MTGLTCQCGKLTIYKCPECDTAPLCADCLDEQDMCKSCRQLHGADHEETDDDEDDDRYDDGWSDDFDDEDEDDGDDDGR